MVLGGGGRRKASATILVISVPSPSYWVVAIAISSNSSRLVGGTSGRVQRLQTGLCSRRGRVNALLWGLPSIRLQIERWRPLGRNDFRSIRRRKILLAVGQDNLHLRRQESSHRRVSQHRDPHLPEPRRRFRHGSCHRQCRCCGSHGHLDFRLQIGR